MASPFLRCVWNSVDADPSAALLCSVRRMTKKTCGLSMLACHSERSAAVHRGQYYHLSGDAGMGVSGFFV